MTASYKSQRLSVRAEVAGVQFDRDIVQFSSTFEMNNIPTACLNVAVGLDIRTKAKARIHEVMQQLKYNAPARVWLNVTPYNEQNVTDTDLTADGEILIFDGYATGVGWQRSTGGASCLINLQHWLADLDYTSALSGRSHPGNPSAWTYTANFFDMLPGQGGASGGQPLWCPVPGGYDAITAAQIERFWSEVLRPWLLSVARNSGQTDPIDPRLLGGQLADDNSADIAIAALQRMRADPDLILDLDGVNDADAIANSIRHWMGKETWNTWANTTIWGKLVGEWSPTYWFAIVPRVNDALVVPFTGGLRGEPWREIDVHEYVQCELSAFMPRGLRAVGIHHPFMMTCGGHNDSAELVASRLHLAALWNPEPEVKGLIMLKDAPKWLCDPTQPYQYSYTTTGYVNDAVVGTVIDPAGTGVPARNRVEDRHPVRIERDMKTMLMKLAHHWFACEMLKGRVGELSGRLRFDICPGSQVRIRLGSSRHVDDDQLAQPLLGSVMRVSTIINSEMQRAGTAFALAHLRTDEENRDDRYSVNKPPLYRVPWFGDVLQET